MMPGTGVAEQDAESAFRPRNDLIAVLRRRSRVFLAVSVCVFGLAVLALAVLSPRYLATSSIIVAELDPGADAVPQTGTDKIGDPADLESQILLIKTPRVMRQVLDGSDARSAIERECLVRERVSLFGIVLSSGAASCERQAANPDTQLEQIQSRYSVAAAGRSRVINITYESPLPDVARIMANALASAFLVDRQALTLRAREDSATSLRQEVKRLETSLRADEDKIQAFRRQNGLIRGSIAPITTERLSSITQSLTLAEAARAEAAARLEEIRKAQKGNLADSPTVMASRTISDLKQQLTNVELQLSRAATVFGPRHPAYFSLEQVQDALKRRLDAEMQSIANGAQNTLDTATATTVSLRQKMRSLETEAGTAADDEASIADLVRSAETKRAKYADLSKKIGEFESQRPSFGNSARLVSPAEQPLQPFFPKRTPFLVGGLLLAILAGGAAALAIDRMDKGLRSAASVADAADTQSLAELPFVSDETAGWLGTVWPRTAAPALDMLLLRLQDDHGFQEALSSLYASLLIRARAKPIRSILMASALPGEGRTATTLALARAVALTGQKVLVIECDFQRPTITTTLELGEAPGLGEVLQGTITTRQAIFGTNTANLFILPAGRPIANAGNLLGSAKMADVLRAASRFDLVLIDSPPHLVRKDASLLAPNVDAVLCLAQWGVVDAASVAAMVRSLTAAGGNVLGVALSQVDAKAVRLYESHPEAPRVLTEAAA